MQISDTSAARPGKINLYAGKDCVQYNLPQAEADDRLIELIKERGRWQEPPGAAPDRSPPTPQPEGGPALEGLPRRRP